MTERPNKAVSTSAEALNLGPSTVRFEDGALIYDIAERAAPIPFPVRGMVIIRPETEQSETFTLDANDRHVWRPIWPSARAEIRFEAPDAHWSGEAYVDSNAGLEPLEAGFTSWNWSRATTQDGAAILYDSLRRDGSRHLLALDIGSDGTARRFVAPAPAPLPKTGWRVRRGTRSDGAARVVQTLEDTPFYSRSLIETDLLGAPRLSMHESLDLTRFSSNWVKMLLPFRMPRAF